MKEDTDAIQDAETELSEKNVSPTDYDEIMQALQKRKDALDNIERERRNQFYNEAFNFISLVQRHKTADHPAIAGAAYLRRFAEHIAQNTLDLEKTYQSVKEIVDHIASMSEET